MIAGSDEKVRRSVNLRPYLVTPRALLSLLHERMESIVYTTTAVAMNMPHMKRAILMMSSAFSLLVASIVVVWLGKSVWNGLREVDVTRVCVVVWRKKEEEEKDLPRVQDLGRFLYPSRGRYLTSANFDN